MKLMENVPYSGANLKKLRKEECSLSRKELADASGMSESSLYQYENGSKTPTVSALAAIGLAVSKRLKREIVFTADWDADRIKKYDSFNIQDS